MGTFAAGDVLKEVICDYFVNRNLSDDELSESDTDSNDGESANCERGNSASAAAGTSSAVNMLDVNQQAEVGESSYYSEYRYFVIFY